MVGTYTSEEQCGWVGERAGLTGHGQELGLSSCSGNTWEN